MREPIRVEIVTPEVEKTNWGRWVAIAKALVSLIKDVGAISALVLALVSFFPAGKELIVSIFSLSEPRDPSAEQTEAPSGAATQDVRTAGDLSPIGWSYLGKENQKGNWYYPALADIDRSEWSGLAVEPRTAIYLRSEPVSAVNPDPTAVAVIGNSSNITECLRITDDRTSNTGSIWLQGALVECP